MAVIRAVPLLVGLSASWGTSFQILEMAADRRCSGLRKDFRDDFITSAAYRTVSFCAYLNHKLWNYNYEYIYAYLNQKNIS
jgi:hypothetical protein